MRSKIFYDKLIGDHSHRVTFRILVSFLITFVAARVYVMSSGLGIFEDPHLYIKGYHIHHLNYGIFVMAIAGFVALLFQSPKHKLKIATLYGVGLGLTFDEFGMWMRLEDNYWNRMSYDAIVVITLIFISFVYFSSFWYFLLNRLEKRIESIKKRN